MKSPQRKYRTAHHVRSLSLPALTTPNPSFFSQFILGRGTTLSLN